jgi:uncharacterized membrane protein YphA (DoxX/SURF4 family)
MTSQLEAVHGWSFLQRLGFRLAFTYFVLYSLAGFFPRDWTVWIGFHLFKLEFVAPALDSNSGDSMFAYVLHLLLLISSLIVTLIWSVFDFRRANYERLHGFLRLFVRYTLASTMFGYGFTKVFNTQFSMYSLSVFNNTYAETSPMGLLWRFMSFSLEYSTFAGILEVVAGLLLLFRQTTTLGALLTAAVMTNVVMMNFCYDVPVKLGSSQLLFSSIFLLIPEIPRLWQFFVLNRAVSSRMEPVLFVSRWAKYAALTAQVLLIGWFSYGAYGQFLFWRESFTTRVNRQDVINQAKYEKDKYLLLTRGFHWVNEEPFVR